MEKGFQNFIEFYDLTTELKVKKPKALEWMDLMRKVVNHFETKYCCSKVDSGNSFHFTWICIHVHICGILCLFSFLFLFVHS